MVVWVLGNVQQGTEAAHLAVDVVDLVGAILWVAYDPKVVLFCPAWTLSIDEHR